MAIFKEDIVDIELESGTIHRSFLCHVIGMGDNQGNRFGVRLFRNGAAENVGSASVTGLFMAPNGTNYIISGSGNVWTSGNVAGVILPSGCYAVEGQFTLAIKLSLSGVVTTMRIIDGVVSNTGTTGAVVPSSNVPTSDQIIAAYQQAMAVIDSSVRYDVDQSLTAAQKTKARTNIEAAGLAQVVRVDADQSLTSTQKGKARTNINATDLAQIAPAFNEASAYNAGQYVTYNGVLYRLTADHAANTTWANTSKSSVTVDGQLRYVLSQIAPVFNASTVYKAGQYVTYNGALYKIIADHAAGYDWANTNKTAVTTESRIRDALLQIAPVYTAGTAYAAGTYVTYNGELYLLPNGAEDDEVWAGIPKTKTNIGSQITDLKSAFNKSADVIGTAYLQTNGSGYLRNDGTYYNSSYKHLSTEMIPCSPGNTFMYKGKASSVACSALFYNSSLEIIGNSTSGDTSSYTRITIPDNCAFVVFSSYEGVSGTVILDVYADDGVWQKTEQSWGNINESDIVTMAYMGKMLTGNDLLSLVWENGTIDGSTGLPTPHTNECRTQFIPTLKGLTVNVSSTTGAYYYLSKYDKNKNFIEKSSGIRTATFSGDTCAFVRISGYASTRELFLQGVTISTDIDRDLIIEKKKSSNLLYGMIGGSLSYGTINKNPDSASHCISDDYIEVEGGETYTLKFGELSAAGLAVYFAQYNSSKTYISTISKYAITNEISIKLDQSAAYVMIMLYYQWTADIWTDWCPKDITFAKSILPIAYVLPNEITDYVDPDKIYKRITDGMAVNKLSADLKIPGYYFDSLYLPGKVNSIRSAITGSDGNIDVFFFITDMHWTLNQKRSPALINYINSSLRIPMIVNGGDDADAGYGISKVLKDAMYDGDAYDVIGNHEYLSGGNDASNYLYYTMRLNHVDGGNAVRGYYYFDNNIIKTRYIVLAAYRDNGGSAAVGYEQTQLDWLNSVMNVGTGWKIIIFTHFFMNTMTGSILSQSAYNLIEQHQHNGDVVAIIEGHQHFDGVIRTATGIPVIGVTCDKNEPWISEGVDMEPWMSDRTSGTIKEQAFDVMLVNHTAKTITQYRIGCPIRDGTDPEAWTEMESRTTSYDRQ